MKRFRACSIAALLLLAIPTFAWSAHLYPESYYVENWCSEHAGQIEYVLPDRTRIDCLTDTHAIEFDFGDNWYEGLGQALYYAFRSGKKPGIALIIESDADLKYLTRMKATIKNWKLPISVWKITP